MDARLPDIVPNWIAGSEAFARGGQEIPKFNPATGEGLCALSRSLDIDVADAVEAARVAQAGWANTPAVARGRMLFAIAEAMRDARELIARTVALETGKSLRDALGETDGAIAQAQFMAGEGQRLYGRTTTSGIAHRFAMTVREPVGIAGLIIAANTPIANIAWKVFPALISGNAAILKASEDTPATAWLFGRIAHEAGLPAGVLNIIQGYGPEAGEPLVCHPDVGVLSFTGSTTVGKHIATLAGRRLARVSLELGGKNALVVCDDADLDAAVHWSVSSAFSNAGQRCAAASRLVIFEGVYEAFKERFLQRVAALRVGPADEDDFGPVINERQLNHMRAAVDHARDQGATVLAGGERLTEAPRADGYYLAPTVLEGAGMDWPISRRELFGPITCLYAARDFEHALALVNDSPFGLTAAIHTRDFNRAMRFTRETHVGVVSVNGGTYGSEPHMPFGGTKQSGNGTREPGTEALDIYTSLKNVYLNVDPARV